ncbi:beta strand repeat-containing protein [Poriferisphaera sp. WC338]|uniref:beta strand repeat-containing protein n=1 Tax=Poriferisphaera sp. WC338 TaxID=3425129 RepID=UPI003D815134
MNAIHSSILLCAITAGSTCFNTTFAATTSTPTPTSNIWQGDTSDDFFDATNWELGIPGSPHADLPKTNIPTYFGPYNVLDPVTGNPTGVFAFPAGPALIDINDFTSTSTFTMAAYDGLNQLTISGGATLTATGTVGAATNNGYVPTGAIQKAHLILDNGNIDGTWSFTDNSKVTIKSGTITRQSTWNGRIGQFVVDNFATFQNTAGTLNLSKETINNGTISFDATNPATQTYNIAIDNGNETFLTGSGRLRLLGSNHRILGSGTNFSTINNASSHSIQGNGTIRSLVLNNNGELDAIHSSSGNTLLLDGIILNLNAGSNTNVSTFATLEFKNSTINNNDSISIRQNANVRFTGTNTANDVRFTQDGNVDVDGTTTFNNLSLAEDITLSHNTSSVSLNGNIINSGLITFQTGTTTRSLNVDSNPANTTRFLGNGILEFNDTSQRIIGSGTNFSIVENGTGHTIRGNGNIQQITLNNAGTIQASGGNLHLNNIIFNHQGGNITVDNGSSLQLSHMTFNNAPSIQTNQTGIIYASGGTYNDVNFQGTGNVELHNSITTFNNLTTTANVTHNTAAANLRGTIKNNATMSFLNDATTRTFQVDGNGANTTDFIGNGTLQFHQNNHRLLGSGQTFSFVNNGADHTMQGNGTIQSLTLDNAGTIRAENGTLLINAVVLNHVDHGGGGGGGRIIVDNAATLDLTSTTLNNTPTIETNQTGIVNITGSTLNDNSNITGTGTVNLNSTASTFNSLTTTANITHNTAAANLRGTIKNNGLISFTNDATTRTFQVDGNAANTTDFSGNGTLQFLQNNHRLLGSGQTFSFVNNNANHTFAGNGTIQSLTLNNAGNIHAQNGTLLMNAIVLNHQTGGAVTIDNGSTLHINSSTTNSGPIIQTNQTGIVQVTGTTLNNTLFLGDGTTNLTGTASTLNAIENRANLVHSTTSANLRGTIKNRGTITYLDDTTTRIFQVDGNANNTTTFSGSGELLFEAAPNRLAGSGKTFSFVENTNGHSIRGSGTIQNLTLTNTGNIHAQNGTLNFSNSDLIHQSGTVTADTGATLQFTGSSTLTATGGTISGGGVIQGIVINNGASLNPGNSPGLLTIHGNYTHGTNAELVIEIVSDQNNAKGRGYDTLSITGNTDITGDLRVVLNNDQIITQGTTFQILSASSITGTFGSLLLPNGGPANPYFSITYNPNSILLTALTDIPVPEPASLLLLSAASILITRRRRAA